METKRCSKCEEYKPKAEFSRDGHKKDGLRSNCKSCCAAQFGAWHAVNLERERARSRKQYAANPVPAIARSRALYAANPERAREAGRAWRKNNQDYVKAANRAWYAANPAYHRGYVRERSKIDTQFKLSRALRSRLATAVRNGAKGGSAVRDLGCSIAELKTRLESMFTAGMTWDNWAPKGWHIDHIRPLASFDLTDPAQVKVACHFTNLQPLWWRPNLIKGAR